MVNNWAVKWDARGKPVAQLKAAAEDAKGSWCHYVVDMSAIGMSLDTPLVVHSYEGDNFLTWNLGATPLAHMPKGWSPRETAEELDRETLLDGFRRFVKAGRVPRPGSRPRGWRGHFGRV